MGIAGAEWQTLFVPFMAGLNLKADVRAMTPPELHICKDVQFDRVGGLTTRKPFVMLAGSGAIYGGGFLANCRKVFDNDGELVVLTDTGLYAYNDILQKFVLKGTHLAVKVDESPAFATNSDQIDGDRAELSGTIVYCWTDSGKVWVAAKNSTTKKMLAGPIAISGTATRPRLLALQTKIILLYHNGTDASPVSLLAKPLDPTDIATGLAAASTTVFATPNFFPYYDVCAVPSSDTCIIAAQRIVTTSYQLVKLTAAMAVTSSTKARTCDGPIAVSVDPTGTSAQVVRANGANIQGDLVVVSSLADTFTGQAIGALAGTPVNQIAAAHRSVQNGGAYRCYAFWSSGEDPTNAGGFDTQTNWVDTAGTLGTQSAFCRWVGVASRAFAYNGSVYVWLTFGQTSGLGAGAASTSSSGNFQNAYFLLRDDGFLCAKSVYMRGGGLRPTIGRLPGVALTSGSTGFSWCATERRIIAVGEGSSSGAVHPEASTYSMRSPRDVTFTFDSNEARRMARLGRTLYITGGEILQYDGVGLYEVGFHVFPWYFDAIVSATGSIPNGLYGYKSTLRWANGQNEVERSTTATVANATMTGGPSGLATVGVNVPLTHKTTNVAALEVWRTIVNPTDDASFYLVTSRDPSVTSNPNRYLPNAPTTGGFSPTMRDGLTDAQLTTGETSPEPGELPRLAPPAATLILATADRLFLAGVAGDPNRVWYSRQRGDGEVVSFHGALTVEIPQIGGEITGLSLQDGVVVVFRERATFYLLGAGYDNTGGGANYEVRRVPGDVGALAQESICQVDDGTMFQSAMGRMMLTRGFTFEETGARVETYNTDDAYAVTTMTAQNQIRYLTDHRMLVYDTFVKQWSEWTVSDGLDACVWNGQHVYLTATGPKQQASDYTGVTYGMDVEAAFVAPAGTLGMCRVRAVQILGEYASAHSVRVRLVRDYRADGTTGGWEYFDDKTWDVTPTTIGGAEQLRHSPSIQQLEAIKVRLTAYDTDHVSAPTGEALKLTGFALEWAPKQGLYKRLPAAQRE